MTRLLDELEVEINNICENGINPDNIDYLYKLVDVHKDIKNEMYWTNKLSMKGADEMRFQRNKGLEYMLDSWLHFFKKLEKEVETEEDEEMIKEYVEEINRIIK